MPPKPPTKPITSLRQIDISKMDIKDLQNINYQKVLTDIRKKPDLAISIAFPLIAVFICFHLFTKSQTDSRALSNKNAEMEEKLKILTEYRQSDNELKEFIENQPAELSENQFYNMITDFAAQNNVKVESFTPSQNKADPTYDLTSINLKANAKNFNDVGHFIKNIENAPANIRIDNWTATMGPLQGGSYRDRNQSNNEDLWINFQLDITLVTFKQ